MHLICILHRSQIAVCEGWFLFSSSGSWPRDEWVPRIPCHMPRTPEGMTHAHGFTYINSGQANRLFCLESLVRVFCCLQSSDQYDGPCNSDLDMSCRYTDRSGVRCGVGWLEGKYHIERTEAWDASMDAWVNEGRIKPRDNLGHKYGGSERGAFRSGRMIDS